MNSQEPKIIDKELEIIDLSEFVKDENISKDDFNIRVLNDKIIS